jgi:hypothetical protein
LTFCVSSPIIDRHGSLRQVPLVLCALRSGWPSWPPSSPFARRSSARAAPHPPEQELPRR